MSIKEILERLIREKGVSKADIIQYSGVNKQTLYRILRGEITNPHAPTVKALADYFGITTAQLLGVHPLPENLETRSTQKEPEYPAGPLPDGFIPEVWAQVPAVISGETRSVVKAYYRSQSELGNIVLPPGFDENAPHLNRVWQYIYYDMLLREHEKNKE